LLRGSLLKNMNPTFFKVQDIIKAKPYLAWFTSQYNQLSAAAVLEQIINYGDWDDVQAYIKLVGMKKTAAIYLTTINKPKNNYQPIYKNYFDKFFKAHAPEYFK